MKDLLGKTITNPDLGDEVTFAHTATETDGKKTVLDIKLAPKGGNELHFHQSYDETFEVLEGELLIQLGKEIKKLTKGEKTTAPIGSIHRFYSESDQPTRFLVTLEPGHIGFENSLVIGYGLARDGLTVSKGIPKKFFHLAVLAKMSDTNGPGIWKLFTRIFHWFAETKKGKKVQVELIEKYCN